MIIEKKIIQPLLPFIGTFVLVFGYVKFLIFYNHFNIEIGDYLELTEILTLFLDDIVFFLIAMIGVFLFDFFVTPRSEIERDDNVKTKIVTSDKFWIRRKQSYILLKELYWFSTFFIITYIICAIWFSDRLLDLVSFTLPIIAITIFLSLLMEFRYKYHKLYGKELNSTVNNLFFILIIFLVYNLSSVYSDIKKIDNDPTIEISFEYIDKKIKSDSDLIYLGQTKNYFFLYNKVQEYTEVYERSEMSSIRILELKK